MRISLVTVTYNSEATLAMTLESVLAQNHPDYEHIIVDGGSTDSTLDIVQRYKTRYSDRLRWISESDNGIYDAMNKGIRLATSPIVGIINSDDFYHRTDILAKVSDAFEQSDCQAIYGDVRFVRDNDLNKTVRYYSSRNFTPRRFRFGFMPAHPTFFTYKSNFDQLGYYRTDMRISADFELLLRFLLKAKLKTIYLPIDFMKMRMGGRSTESFRSNLSLNREIVKACRENGVWTCQALVWMKYFIKVFEFIFTRQNSVTQ